MNRILSFYNKYELWIFVIISLLCASHVFTFYVFPTLDGPHHLYNANMILGILEGNPLVQDYYKFNTLPISNLIGHGSLAFFNLFLPSAMALNLMIFLYMMGMAFSFRYMMIAISGRFSPLNYSIFPFMLNGSLTLGLFNYCLSIILLFILIGYWIKVHKTLTTKQLLIAGLLLTLMVFSHLLSFVFFGLTIIVLLFYEMFYGIIKEKKIHYKSLLVKILKITLITIPPAILLVIYFMSISDFLGKVTRVVNDDMSLFGNLYYIRPLVIYHGGHDGNANIPLFFGLLALTVLSGIFWYRNGKNDKKTAFNSSFMLTMTLFFLLLLIVVPPGFFLHTMRIRLSLFFFFFLIMWMGSIRLTGWIELLGALFFLFIFTEHQLRIGPVRSHHAINAKDLHSLEKLMEPNSVFLPVNAGTFWGDEFILNYIGSDKPMINLKNPQAYGPFPVMWNYGKMPYTTFGGFDRSEIEIFYMSGPKTNKEREIDYVIIHHPENLEIKRANGEFTNFYRILDSKFEFVAKSPRERTSLYKRIGK
ncbi:MAG: hypothetical protein DRI97_03145 [Bacteroidetes bacterium]|nr:MAG: hypothetical protein DRI97_03145 [Bacteroidota bacterium]RLD82112.1 MAG: hypothetical protein DRJ15_02545 [Bacteroidota bacterium]